VAQIITTACRLVILHGDLDISQTSKQEKYLPTCMLGPLRWNMPKITKSDAKLSEIYEQNEWHLFPGNVIYDF